MFPLKATKLTWPPRFNLQILATERAEHLVTSGSSFGSDELNTHVVHLLTGGASPWKTLMKDVSVKIPGEDWRISWCRSLRRKRLRTKKSKIHAIGVTAQEVLILFIFPDVVTIVDRFRRSKKPMVNNEKNYHINWFSRWISGCHQQTVVPFTSQLFPARPPFLKPRASRWVIAWPSTRSGAQRGDIPGWCRNFFVHILFFSPSTWGKCFNLRL